MSAIYKSIHESDCYQFLDKNPHLNAIVERDLFSGRYIVYLVN